MIDMHHGIEQLERRDLLAGISGTVFFDANGDGFRQLPQDGALEHIVVYLDLNRDGRRTPNEPATATSFQGFYAFTGLPSGTYSVRTIPRPGLTPTQPASGEHLETIQGNFTRANRNFALGPAPAGPEIDVVGSNDLPILNNSNKLQRQDGTLFGRIPVTSGQQVRSFVIENTGDTPLVLSIKRVRVLGTNKADFKVVRQAPRAIAPGSSAVIRIAFDPSAKGQRNATVTIGSNDTNEGTYRFAIRGIGT